MAAVSSCSISERLKTPIVQCTGYICIAHVRGLKLPTIAERLISALEFPVATSNRETLSPYCAVYLIHWTHRLLVQKKLPSLKQVSIQRYESGRSPSSL